MTQTIKLPNGDALNFPDDMPDDAIAKAISDNYPEFAPKSAAPKVLAGLPVGGIDAPADHPRVLAGLPVPDSADSADAPLIDAATNTDPAQNQFAPGRMSRTDYEKEFRTLNPRAPQSAVDAALAQYDQQKAAQLKAADAKRQAGPMKPVPSADQFFNDRLNARLQQHTASVNDPQGQHGGAGVVPQLPGYQQQDFASTTTKHDPNAGGNADDESALGAAGSFLGRSTSAGLYDLAGAGAKLLDAINPFTLSESDAAVLYKNDPAKLKQMQDESIAMGLSRFARSMQENSSGQMEKVSARGKRDYGQLEYATTDASKSALLSPVKVVGDAVRSLPSSLAMGVTAYFTRGASLRAEQAALAAGLGEEAATAAGVQAAMKFMGNSAAASEGAIGYAQQAIQSADDASKIPMEQLAKTPQFQNLLQHGYTPETARAKIIADIGEHAGQIGGLVDAVTNKFGGAVLGKIISEGGPFMKRVLAGAADESATEFVQSAGEQMGQNYANQLNADPNTPLMQGVGEAAVAGAAVGGFMGGATAGVAGHHGAHVDEHQLEQHLEQTIAGGQQAQATRNSALSAWQTNGLSPSSRAGGSGRVEPTWSEAVGTPPAAPAAPAARVEPTLGDVMNASSVDEAIAAASAITDSPATLPNLPTPPAPASPHATPADIDALEEAAGMTPDQAIGEMQARAQEAAAQRTGQDEPPVPAGMTRLYHGSATHGRYDGPAWFSTDRRYAENYRPGAELQYVDYPTGKINAHADPDGYGQTPANGFHANLELSSDETGLRKPLNAPAGQVDDAGDWHPFPAEMRSLGVPRAQMPQIRAEHRGAMVNFLNARGISHEQVEVPAESLRPTQREFSVPKVEKALEYQGGNRSILISSDNYVLDGHHQWMAAALNGQPVQAIRLNAPIKQLVQTVHEFPSATVDASSASATPAPAESERQLSPYEASQQRIARQEEAVRKAIEAQAQHRAGQAPQEPGTSVPTAAERVPLPAPKPTAGQRMRERIRQSNPFLAFLATHGLNIEERSDTGGQKGRIGNIIVPGFGGSLYRKTGARLDELAQLAHEAGFLSNEDMANPADTGGTRKLADMIERAVHSREVIEQPGLLEAHVPSADQKLIEEAQRLGIDHTSMDADQLYDAVRAAHHAEDAHREVTGASDVDEQDVIDHYESQIHPQQLADADIPLDLNDPRLAPDHNLTDEEINAIFGIQEASGPRADRGEAESHAAEPAREGAALPGRPSQREIRERLKTIAGRLGIHVQETNGGFVSSKGMVAIPAEDQQAEGAQTPEHVFAHELGHAIISKRGLNFVGIPMDHLRKKVSNWNDLVAASKAYRPAVWEHANEKIRKHARKPNEVIADALGSVLIGEQPLSMLAPMMDSYGINEWDLGLREKGQKDGDNLLTSYSRDDVLKREAEAADRAKAEQAEADRLERERKQQQDAKEARARADATVDDFQLGQDAHDQLSGQTGLFDAPAAPARTGLLYEQMTEQEREAMKAEAGEVHVDYRSAYPVIVNRKGKAVVEWVDYRTATHYKTKEAARAGLIEAAKKPESQAIEAANREEFDAKSGVGKIVAARERYSDKFGVSWASTNIATVNTMGEAADIAHAVAESGADNITDMRQVAQDRQRDAVIAKVKQVHQYNPERARPLLLIPCAEGKLEGTHKAIDLYKGALFDVYRKWKPTENRPDVYILSAKHGIVHADTLLNDYEQPMTKERLAELLAKPVDLSLFKGKNFNEVYIAGSANYRQLGQQYVEEMRKAGFVGPDAPVDHPPQGAGIGDQRGHFADYLRKVDMRGGENAAELSDQLDAEHEKRQRIAGERERLANGTAPEHVTDGVDDRELGQIVSEFKDANAEMMQGGHPVSNIFAPPKKNEVVRLADKARATGKLWDEKESKQYRDWLDEVKKLRKAEKEIPAALAAKIAAFEKKYLPFAAKLKAEAAATVEKWKEHARAQGENPATRSANSQKVVLSFFDLSGEWSKPWEEAGYQVYRFDIQDDPVVGDVNNFSTDFFNDWFGSFEGMDIHAILAACPCTDFASSGNRHFAAKDADGRTVASVKLVHQTLKAIEYFKPAVWALENPVGRIEKLGGLPPWRLSFDPYQLGDDYTKKTLIWGRFNADLPVAPAEPTKGSKMWSQYGGKSIETKNARSETPEGFSYGFFLANNAIDNPVLAIHGKYDRLNKSLIEKAVAAGVTEQEIDHAVEDHYYQDQDDDAANEAIRQLIAEAPEHEPSETAAPESATKAPESETPAAKTATDDTGADIPADFYQGVTAQYRTLGTGELTDMPAHEALAKTREDIQQLEDMLKCMGG